MNLEEEITKELAESMCSAVDSEILMGILVDTCGWYKVQLDSLQSRKRSIDILEWCNDKCRNDWKHRGRTFVFEDHGDAVNFIFKWV